MNEKMNKQMKVPLHSTRLRPLWGRCPKRKENKRKRKKRVNKEEAEREIISLSGKVEIMLYVGVCKSVHIIDA